MDVSWGQDVVSYNIIANDALYANKLIAGNDAGFTSPQNLTISASSNLLLQASNLRVDHDAAMGVSFTVDASEYFRIGLSNARLLLRDTQQRGVSVQASDMHLGRMHVLEEVSAMVLSAPDLPQGIVLNAPVTAQGSLFVSLDSTLNGNLAVSGDTGIAGRLITSGNAYVPKLSLYKPLYATGSNATTATQVGYTWTINDRDQLELVKYTFFGDDTEAVAKRVAIFGASPLNSGDTSDVSLSNTLITEGVNSNNAPFLDPYQSPFIMARSNMMYTLNTLAINTSNVNPLRALLVNGAAQATNMYVDSNVVSSRYLTTSDLRLKNVVASIGSSEALEKIMELQPIVYSWKADDASMPHAGFGAQNVSSILPLAASKCGDVLNVDTTALLAYVVSAVQELKAQVADLRLAKA